MTQRPRGFSLIELMVAVTLGMVAVAAVGSVFIYGSRNYKQDDKVSRMQDELRFAMAQLSQDLEMAGFFAQVRNIEEDMEVHNSATVSGDCGPTRDGGVLGATNSWTYHNVRASVFTLGDATAALATARFPCINDESGEDEFVGGSDIIAIKRLGDPVTPSSTTDNKPLLRSNGVQFWIYKQAVGGAGSPPVLPQTSPPSVTVYPVNPVVWYIRKYAFAGQSPPVPSLCRQYLAAGATPTMTAECVAQGIEDMQLEFGFDVTGGPQNLPDGIVDYFDPIGDLGAPLDGSDYNLLSRIIAVRVHLLARSADEDPHYRREKAAKTYTLGQGYTPRSFPNDGYYRKVLSSVVLLRNPSNRLTPYELPQ